MRHLNIAALAITAVLSVSALGGSASAMPLSGLASVATQRADTVEHVSWACGPYRCWYVRSSGRPVLAAALWLLGLASLGLARLGLAPPLGLAAAAACYRARDAARTA